MDSPKLRGFPWAGRGREVPRWSRHGFRKGEAYLQHCPNVGAIVRDIFNIVPTWISQSFVDPPGRAVGGKSQDGAARGSGRVKHIFNIAPTLARLCVRKISETTKREGKQRGKRTKQKEKQTSARDMSSKRKKIYRLRPYRRVSMEPSKIKPRGGHNSVVKASGGLLGARARVTQHSTLPEASERHLTLYPLERALAGKSKDGAAMGDGRVKNIFHIVPTLARMSTRSKKQQSEKKHSQENVGKRKANQRTRHVFQNKKSKGCAPTADS